MYTEAVIEFLELKIAVLRVAYSIGEWAMKKFGWFVLYCWSVHKSVENVDLSMLSLSVAVPGLVLYVLLLLNTGPST